MKHLKQLKHLKQYTNIIIMVVVVAVIALNFVTIYKRKREGVGLESLQKDRELEWDDLDPDRRRAWNFLGWTKTAWNSKIDSAGGIPNNPEQDKKDSIRKYTTYMKSVLKRIRPTSTRNKIKINNARRSWLDGERTKARNNNGGWVNGVYISCGDGSSTAVTVAAVRTAAVKAAKAVATATAESAKQDSINKYKSAYADILKKYPPISRGNRQKSRREISKWVTNERNSARAAGGGWVNGTYVAP